MSESSLKLLQIRQKIIGQSNNETESISVSAERSYTQVAQVVVSRVTPDSDGIDVQSGSESNGTLQQRNHHTEPRNHSNFHESR